MAAMSPCGCGVMKCEDPWFHVRDNLLERVKPTGARPALRSEIRAKLVRIAVI